VQILLNSFKNIKSVNVNNFEKIELLNKTKLINEYDIKNVLSVTELFDAEREANEIYRIYGKIEYLSLLNRLKNNYSLFADFFQPQSFNSKNILNSFDFYLVKPAKSGYTNIVSGGSSIEYIRYFEVIATPKDFDIYPAGFSNNVYGEQAYAFNLNKDIDISNYFDNFNFPITELFLYAQYKPATSPLERLSCTMWSVSGVSTTFPFIPNTGLTVGDYVKTSLNFKIGDLIEYSNLDFLQVQSTQQPSLQIFYVQTPYNNGQLIWKYNPFIPLRLRYFANELNKANTGDTSYEQTSAIPSYATKIDNKGNYIWRNIMSEGFIDPTTNLGVNYPFINKKRYLFTNIIFGITPDLNDPETLSAFTEVYFTENTTKISVTPAGDINNIGKPCQ
jgi:hypothetical protein